jgi:methionyl-tRNA formyltransferase
MQRKIAIFLNGYRGKEVFNLLKKIKIEKIFYQKEITKNRKISIDLIKKKLANDKNFIFILIGINKIISSEILKYPKYGCYNCHAGSLPKYRGASPIVYQLLNNEKFGSCYILKVKKGIDDGPYIYKKSFLINNNDNSTTISKKVNKIFFDLIKKLIFQFRKNIKFIEHKQSRNKIFYWTKRYPGDSKVNWSILNSRAIIQLIKSQTFPYSGAFNFIKQNNKKIVFEHVKIGPKNLKGVPGRVVRLLKNSFIVLTIDGSIQILKLRHLSIKKLIDNKVVYYGCDLI